MLDKTTLFDIDELQDALVATMRYTMLLRNVDIIPSIKSLVI